MKRRADLVSPVFMWVAVFVVALIAGLWFIRQVKPLQGESERITYDLSEIKDLANIACASKVFYKEYNPRTEQGEIFANSTSVCINSSGFSDCVGVMCPLVSNLSQTDKSLVNLKEITFVYIVKDKNITLYTDSTIGTIKGRYVG